MNDMRHCPWGALLAVFLSGCGNPSAPSQATPTAATASKNEGAGPKTYAAKDLPAVGERLPALDQGRVELASPKGWRVLSRDAKYLTRFVKAKEENSLPRITVSPPLPAPAGIENVTEENVSEFAAAMQKRSEGVKGRRMLEPERPIILGDYAWSRHVRYLKAPDGPAALQSLATVRGGRLYVIELTVLSTGDASDDFKKAILAYRDDAYAVAASWKFLEDSSATAAGASTKEIAQDAAPAKETQPAEEKPPAADKPPEKKEQ